MNTNILKTKRQRRGPHGFTLIELLLVLTILAILAAVVVPKFSGVGETARIKSTKAQISSFATSLDMFEVDNGYYPKRLEDLSVQPRDASHWRQYMEKIPLDQWGHPYIYVVPGKHRPGSYDLSSAGPNGTIGDQDDIGNWNLDK